MSASLTVGHALSATIVDNLTRYVAISGRLLFDATEDNVEVPVREAGSFSKLYVYVSSNTISVDSVFTLRKSRADTSVTLTYSADQTGIKEDTSNSASFANTDEVSLKCVTANEAGTNTLTLDAVGIQFDPTDTSKCVSFLAVASTINYNNDSTTAHFVACGYATVPATTETTCKLRIRAAFTARDLYVLVSSNGRSTDTIFRSRKNGANGGQSVTYTSAQTGVKEDNSGTDSLAAGDDYNLAITESTGGGSIAVKMLTSALVSTGGVFVMLAGANPAVAETVNASTTTYMSVGGFLTAAAEANVEVLPRFTFTASELGCHVTANSIATSDTVITLRDNNGDSAVTVSYATSQTGLKNDSTHTTTITSAVDEISFKVATPATSGSISFRWMSVLGTTTSATPAFQDVAARVKVIAGAYKDVPARVKVIASATKDVASRVVVWARSYKDVAARVVVNATAWKDVAARVRVTVAAFKDVAARVVLIATGAKDVASRARVTVAAWKDVAARVKVIATGFQDVAARVRVVATAFRDITGRVVLWARGYADVGARVVVAAVGAAWKDIAARVGVVAPAFKDVQARVRVVASAWKDVASRVVVLVRGHVDVAARVRIIASAWKDLAARVLVTVAGAKDVSARVVVRALSYADIAARVRLVATASKDVAARARVTVRAWKDVAARVKVIGLSYKDIAARVVVISATVVEAFKDVASRVVVVGPPYKNVGARVCVGAFERWGGTWLYTASRWSGQRFEFEAEFKATAGTVAAQLVDATTGAAVPGTLITQDGATLERLRSAAVALTDGHEYQAQFGGYSGGAAGAFIKTGLVA